MSLIPRVKCLVSITSGTVSGVAPIQGFNDFPATITNSFGYVLEDSAGQWEIGEMHSASSRSRVAVSSGLDSYNGFGSDHAGLTFTIIALPSAYVDNGRVNSQYAVTGPPLAEGEGSCAAGQGARALYERSVAFGTGAGSGFEANPGSTSVGYRARADHEASGAVGCMSRTAHQSETVIGHYMMPHTSNIAVMAANSPDAPGTPWLLTPITSVDDYAYVTSGGALGAIRGPYTAQNYEYFFIRVRGTIFATDGEATVMRVFDVDFATYRGAVVYNATSIKSTAGAATDVAFGISSAGEMTLDPGATGDSLRVRGVLRVDKIPVGQGG